ncbi:ribokinase [Paenibacillaceae bacterium WGS1546]|uniref:ribokinase n=1 Tax=Cohnella sp. WGS1546 TaxID=3366810 RepID=UPI00372D2C81
MHSSQRILVVGSANADVILHVPRNPVSGESLLVRDRLNGLGGKGSNRAVALSRLGADMQFSCKIGRDAPGDILLSAYERENIAPDLIFYDEQAGTGTAYVLVEENGNNTILSYMGANETYTRNDLNKLLSAMPRFGYLSLELEISLPVVEELLSEARARGVHAIVDAGPARSVPLGLFRGALVLSPNEVEAAELTGIAITSESEARQACVKLYESGCRNVILKLGAQGAMLYDGGEFIRFPAYRGAGEAVDTTAAGDCFMAALTFGLSRGMDMHGSIRYANVAAAISVTRPGAIDALPFREEVDRLYARSLEEES